MGNDQNSIKFNFLEYANWNLIYDEIGTKCMSLPNDSFSPESGGNVNPNNAIEAISTHGTIKLKK